MVDIAENGQELYLRMAASELGMNLSVRSLHKKSKFDTKLQGGKQFLLYKAPITRSLAPVHIKFQHVCCFSFQLQFNIWHNVCMNMLLESWPSVGPCIGDKMLRLKNRGEHRR